jgi:hypothetical protein
MKAYAVVIQPDFGEPDERGYMLGPFFSPDEVVAALDSQNHAYMRGTPSTTVEFDYDPDSYDGQDEEDNPFYEDGEE